MHQFPKITKKYKPILPIEQVIIQSDFTIKDYPNILNDCTVVRVSEMNWKVDIKELIKKKYIRQAKSTLLLGELILADDNFDKVEIILKEKTQRYKLQFVKIC